jgi:hypothetical protein
MHSNVHLGLSYKHTPEPCAWLPYVPELHILKGRITAKDKSCRFK